MAEDAHRRFFNIGLVIITLEVWTIELRPVVFVLAKRIQKDLAIYLDKQLSHSRLLDMKLMIIANSALRPSLAIYPNARTWNNR